MRTLLYTAPFVLYGRYNPAKKDSFQIAFSKFGEGAIYFGAASNAKDTLHSILNADANCVPVVFDKTFATKHADFFNFAIIDAGYQSVIQYKITEKYNDFIAIYFKEYVDNANPSNILTTYAFANDTLYNIITKQQLYKKNINDNKMVELDSAIALLQQPISLLFSDSFHNFFYPMPPAIKPYYQEDTGNMQWRLVKKKSNKRVAKLLGLENASILYQYDLLQSEKNTVHKDHTISEDALFNFHCPDGNSMDVVIPIIKNKKAKQ